LYKTFSDHSSLWDLYMHICVDKL